MEVLKKYDHEPETLGEPEDKTSPCTFKFSPIFRKRGGTTDRGKDYEHFYITNLILKLIAEDEVENFSLSSNDETFGSFDDVVIEIKNREKDEVEVYALQLKHCKNKILRSKDLVAPKGNFSLPGYFQDFRNNESCTNASVKTILLTNCKANFGKKIQLEIDQEMVDVDVMKGTPNAFLTTSKRGVCHVFSPSKHHAFFQNFSLYANELNVEHIKKDARQKFEQMFKCDGSRFNGFVDFITNWSLAEGKKMKLDKDWMKKVVTLCVVSTCLRPLSFSPTSSLTRTRQLFREMTGKFPVTVLKNEYHEKIIDLWSDVKVEDMTRVKKLKDMYQGLLGEGKNMTLWLLGSCPLVLEGCPQVHQVMKICKIENLIVLESSKYREKKEDCLRSLHDIKNHTQLYQKVVGTFTFTLEGQREVPLRDLLVFCQIDKMITTDLLVEMMDGPFLIGSPKEKLPPCHMERSLAKILIDSRYIENIDSNTMIVIEDVPESFEKSGIYTSRNHLTPEEINKIILQNPGKKIHLFRYFDDKSFEWIHSRRCEEVEDCITDLEKYRLELAYLHESEVFKAESKINIICADPGMGKTTLMKSLKLTTPSTIWTCVIQARNHASHFRKNKTDPEKLLNDLCDEYRDELDRSIFARLIEENRVQIIWDGLDEVSEESLEIILGMVKTISGKGIRQWLTSRIHLRSLLETSLDTFSRNIKQFDSNEQKKYIEDRLGIPPEESPEIFSKIRRNIVAFSNNDILGIPLQIYMLTELLLRNKSKYFKFLDGIFTILEMYEHFVEEKFNIFYKEKTKLDFENELTYQIYAKEKQETINWYKSVAFDLYLASHFGKIFDKVFRQNRIVKKCGDRIGLITNVPNLEFTHNSYGEYFAALYLHDHNPTKVRESSFVSNPKYDNIRFFLDLMLSKNRKNREACVAILYKNIPLLEKCSIDDMYEKDAIGRDILELSCAWIPKSTVEVNYREIKKVGYDNVAGKFYQMRSTISQEVQKLMVLLPFLVQYYDEDREIFRLACLPAALYHAIKFDSTFILENLKRSFDTENVYKLFDEKTVLLLAVKLNARSVLSFFMLDRNFHVTLAHNLKEILGTVNKEMMTFVLHLKDFYGRMTIHNTCSIMKNPDNFKFLINKYDDINVRDAHGQTPLHRACVNLFGCEFVKLLIDGGAKINFSDDSGQTPLHKACENCNGYEMTVKLLEAGADANASDDCGRKPIHYACRKTKGKNVENRVRMVQDLIENTMELDQPDSSGIRPLHYACENNTGYEIVKLLIDHGASVNLPDSYAREPLYYACNSKQRLEIGQYLLRKGAGVGALLHYGFENNGFGRVYPLLSDSPPIATPTKNLALSLVEFILNSGLPVDNPYTNNRTLLHYACDINEGCDLAQLLLDYGANINATDTNGSMPIHYACKNMLRYKTLQLLVENGALVDAVDHDGRKPIHYACQAISSLLLVKLLVKNGASCDPPDGNNLTPLHYASRNATGDEITKFLLQNGACVNARDTNERTPLHYVCKGGSEETISLLLDKGADINAFDASIRTPLHYACENIFSPDIVRLLISKGARVDVLDESGKLPVHYACAKKQNPYETIVLLTDEGAKGRGLSRREYALEQNLSQEVLETLELTT